MVGATAGAAAITASISDNTGTVITNDIGITVNLQAPPAVPTGVTATVVSSTQINLSWTASAGATGYKIYRNGTLLKAVSTQTAADAGLTPNTQYVYAVTATDVNGNESNLSSQVSATTDVAAPPVPTALTATGASQSQVDLAWSAGAGAAPAGYEIYKAGILLKAVTTTTSTDTGLTASTQYCYAVSSYDSTGNESAQTTQVCATTQPPPPPIPPPVPTGLAATAASQSQVDLSWTASSGAASYKISRGGVDLSTTSTTVYSDTGLTASTSYCYTVSAVDSSGNASARSGQICVTTLTVPPPSPTGLAAVTASTSQINLSWTASAGAAGYKVYRSGTFLKSVATTNTSDTSLQSGKQYCYQVTAYDATGSESAQSLPSCATTTTLPTPDNFAIAAASHSQINLSWTASAGAIGYKIYKSGSFLKSVGGTTFSDTGLTASTQFCYTVSAYDSAGNESIQASQLCAATLTPPPPVPAGLTGTAISPTQIDLAWSASTGAADYKIYRNGTALPAVAATSFSDMGRTVNTKYCYTVAALDSTGSESAQSDQACVTTPALAAATLLTATAISSSQINLSWTAPAGAVQYNIFRGGTLLKSVSSAAAAVTASDTELTPNTQYCYSIYAFDVNGKSSLQGSQVCATTYNPPPAAPTGLTASAVSTSSITLTWSAVTGASTYKIYRDGVFLIEKGTTNHADTLLAGSTKYCYTVTALDATGSESAQSSQACGNTGLLIPTVLTATAASVSQINLSWAAATGAATYKIYKGGVLLKTVVAAAGTNTTSDAGLSPDTLYCYSLSSVNSTGDESAQSSSVCATTNLPPPPTPTNLVATPVLNSQVDLTWNTSAGATGYKIYRDDVLIKSVTTNSLSDQNLTASTRYCYAVSAYDANSNDSARSAAACATTDVAGPSTPGGFSVTPLTSTSIQLSWTAPAPAVKSYKIYQDGAFATGVNATPTDPLAINVIGLTPNTQYCYRMSAVDSSGKESALTAQLCGTTYVPPPADPVFPVAAVMTTSQITLSWTASSGAAQYKIYRSDGQVFTSTMASYTNNGAAAATNYCYQITAVDASGSESGKSAQVCADTGLTVPGGMNATAASSTQINLSWNAATGATGGYKVYKNGSLLGSVDTLSLVDGGLTANTQYCYGVSAVRKEGGAESARSSQVCVTTLSPPMPATIDLLVSSPQLNSDGASTVTLTALVKDSGNRAMSGQAVTFTADSGVVNVTSGTTDAAGKATATLGTGGNKKNRTINLSASSGAFSNTNTVDVVGTTVQIQGATTLAMGGKTTLTIFLKDSSGAGISGKSIALTSVKGNTFSVNPVTTDASGQATVEVTAMAEGADTITATCAAMNATGTLTLTVSATTFSFIAPTAGQEVDIRTDYNIQVRYRQGAAPYNGKTVNFTTTRGIFSSATATTDINGDTNIITISSTTAGTAVITASVTGDTSIQQNIEFVAVTADLMTLQANPTILGPNTPPSTTEKSTITAVIYDLDRNLVKNKTIDFELTDVTGGTISPASAVTDSLGKANTVYTSSATDSAVDGVTIKATVRGTAITKEVRLTVAKKARYISLGTSKFSTVSVSSILYEKSYVVLVTDATGNPVANATVNLSVVPVKFMKGSWTDDTTQWVYAETVSCANEDIQSCIYTPNSLIVPNSGAANPSWCLNGILDLGEDTNGNNRLDPGGIATVPSSVTTDANGYSEFKITYAKTYSPWVEVQLQARTATSGSDAVAVADFILPSLVADYPYSTVPPPNSPFGSSAVCTNTN